MRHMYQLYQLLSQREKERLALFFAAKNSRFPCVGKWHNGPLVYFKSHSENFLVRSIVIISNGVATWKHYQREQTTLMQLTRKKLD